MTKKDFWKAFAKLLVKGAVWAAENPEVVAGFVNATKK